MKLETLTVMAHRRALAMDRQIPAERNDLAHLPMRWTEDEGDMIPIFDERRLTEEQEAEIREILERMAGKVQQKDMKLLVRAHMEAFGRFGVRVTDLAAILSVDKKTALKHLRGLVEDDLVEIREEPNPRKGGTARKRYFWTQNQPEYGSEDAHTEDEDPQTANLHVKNDRSVMSRRQAQDGTGIVHHGASAHAPQCQDRCSACKWALETALMGEIRSAARQAGGTGFSVGLAERIAAREAAESTIFASMRRPNTSCPAEMAEWESGSRDRARNLVRAVA